MKHGNQFGLILAVVILLCIMYFSSVITGYAPFLILLIAATAISFISIFLYRKRLIQIRLSIFNIIILIAYQAWIIYLFFDRPEGSAFTTTAVFPAVAAILTWLAFRYIARDEAMVRSVNRLRK